MPYLSIQTNVEIPANEKVEIARRLSQTAAEMLGKPERYVMIALSDATPMLFDGNDAPLAYLQLKSLGLPETQTAEYSRTLCGLINSLLGIAPDRIYIEFSSPPRHMWGWNEKTFG